MRRGDVLQNYNSNLNGAFDFVSILYKSMKDLRIYCRGMVFYIHPNVRY